MTSVIKVSSEDNVDDHLPPVISSNLRTKIEAEQLPIDVIKLKQRERVTRNSQLVYYEEKLPLAPTPAHPLLLYWEPNYLQFELFEEPIVAKVGVWNRSARPIFLQCCGLWNDSSRLGAGWCSYPRKRYWLPPGFKANLFVRATPRPNAPIPTSNSALQIAATHLRDNVVGYFMVPIHVSFLKYEPPCVNECG